MISTILLILKILLIILLSILGFVLLIVLLVLFCPFRYRIYTEKKTGFLASVKVSFLLSFVSVFVIYSKGINIKAKVLGITVFDKLKKDAKNKAKDNTKQDLDSFDDIDLSEDSLDDSSLNLDNSIESVPEEKMEVNEKTSEIDFKEEAKEDFSGGDTGKESLSEYIEINNTENNENCSKESDNKKSLFEKISEFWQKIISSVENFFYKAADFVENFSENTEEKINKIADTYNYYDRLLHSKGTEKVIEFLKKRLIRIFKAILPRRGRVNVMYGSEDPAKVGKMFELYGLVSAFLPKKSSFKASFEEEILEFDCTIKGRIFLFIFAITGLEILFNKRLKRFIKLLKREER